MQRREPISLDELLRKRQQAEEAEKRPRFLSKEERARLAMERRQQQVAASTRPSTTTAVASSRASATPAAESLGAEAAQLIKVF
jgi:ATP-dependent RNA helicase DDX23/PRP28